MSGSRREVSRQGCSRTPRRSRPSRATLTEQGTKTKVVVEVKGAPAGEAQPLHVHKGTRALLDPKPAYGLATLTSGKSETTLDVPLASLEAGGFPITPPGETAESER